MSEQRDERFYVHGNTSFDFFKAFCAALEKMAGHRLADEQAKRIVMVWEAHDE